MPVLIDGYLYGCNGGPESKQGTFCCLDAATGELMWEEDLRAEGKPKTETVSLIAADGKLIILEDTGILRIAEASPSSYKEISSCELPAKKMHQWWMYPVLYKSRIYCRNINGDLVCIDVSKKS